MKRTAKLCFAFLLLLSVSAKANDTSIQDELQKYGLPRGLIPDAIESHSLAPDGSFKIGLRSTCYVHFSRLVYYDKTITGKVSYGKITDLTGIQAKKLFVWVSLTGMEVKFGSNEIEFKVGILSETLSMSEFQTIPACKSKINGCGRRAVRIAAVEENLSIVANYHIETCCHWIDWMAQMTHCLMTAWNFDECLSNHHQRLYPSCQYTKEDVLYARVRTTGVTD